MVNSLMPDDCSEIKVSPELEAKILELAVETGASYEEVVNAVVRHFFEMVDSDRKDVPSLVEKVRAALKKRNAG